MPPLDASGGVGAGGSKGMGACASADVGGGVSWDVDTGSERDAGAGTPWSVTAGASFLVSSVSTTSLAFPHFTGVHLSSVFTLVLAPERSASCADSSLTPSAFTCGSSFGFTLTAMMPGSYISPSPTSSRFFRSFHPRSSSSYASASAARFLPPFSSTVAATSALELPLASGSVLAFSMTCHSPTIPCVRRSSASASARSRSGSV